MGKLRLLLLLVWREREIVKPYVQCHIFAQTLLGRLPSDKYQSTFCTVRDLCKNVSSAVLFASNGNSYTICMESDMCICVYTHIIYNIETLVGQNKFKELGQQ
jgi:hypothetical protein